MSELVQFLPEFVGALVVMFGAYVGLMRAGTQAVNLRNETDAAVLRGWELERREASNYAHKYEATLKALADLRVKVVEVSVEVPLLKAELKRLTLEVDTLEAALAAETRRADEAERQVALLRQEIGRLNKLIEDKGKGEHNE